MWSILWKCTNLVLGLEYVKVGKESKEEAPCALRGRLVSQEGLAWAPGWPRVARALVLDKEFPSPFTENSLYRKRQPFSRCSRDGQASEGHWVWSIVRATGSGLIRGARFFSSGSFCAYITYFFSFYFNLHNQRRS